MVDRPNILLILTDQQRFDTLACTGNKYIKTPNLDQLADKGTCFTSAYTPSPVCVPARCALHYGQYPMRTGCLENNFSMPSNCTSIPDALNNLGYRCHAIGKRHFTPDPQSLRGFGSIEKQEEIVEDFEKDDYLKYLKVNNCDYAIEPHGARGEAYYIPQVSSLPPKHHPSQWVGDRSVEWIGNQQLGKEPFFLFSSFIHPHPPFSPPTPWHKLYRGHEMPLPKLPNGMELLYTYTNYIQNRYKGRDTGLDVSLIRLMKSYYWASISFIDFQIGRIVTALEQSGKINETLIIFTSDHGEFLGDYNCFGKRSFLDSAARVPLICSLPNHFEAGLTCDTPVSLVDVMPTVLAAANAQVNGLDGVNLSDVAQMRADRAIVFGHYQGAEAGIYAAISKKWKYMWSAPDQKEFLFDRIKDPNETRNCAYNIVNQSAVEYMRSVLQDHIRTMPGHEEVVNENGWIAKQKIQLQDDPDAGLIIQDPPCFIERLKITGYTNDTTSFKVGEGANFNPLQN